MAYIGVVKMKQVHEIENLVRCCIIHFYFFKGLVIQFPTIKEQLMARIAL